MIWFIPFALIFLLVTWKIVREWTEGQPIKIQWFGYLVAVTFLVRLPTLLYNRVTNVDEAQTIAHALTLMRFPVPWKGIDFTTNGPLNAYVFYIPAWLGIRLDYVVSHGILLGLLILLVWSLFVTLRNWLGRETAIMGIIPVLLFLAWGQRNDFVHQASEFWCVVPFSAALSLFSVLTIHPEKRKWYNWYLIGFLLGVIPYGKPQGAPPALMVAGFIFGYIAVTEGRKGFWKAIVPFGLGGLTLTAVFLTAVVANDALKDFFNLFIYANARYATLFTYSSGFIPTFIWGWGWFSGVSLVFLLALMTALLGWIYTKRLSQPEKWGAVLCVAVVYAGAFAVERAGRPFDHYLIVFLFPGVFLLYGWGVHLMQRVKYRAFVVYSGFVCLTGYLLYTNKMEFDGWVNQYTVAKPWHFTVSPVSQYVLEWATEPDDCITVYGYYNEIYVETQLPSAVRLVTVYQHSSIWPALYTPYYLNDLYTRKPVVFVDAIDGPQDFRQELVNRENHDLSQVPGLAAFLDEHYAFVKEIDGNRVYVRKDRLAQK